MQFLKTLFWVVLAIVAVVFAMNNWQPAKVMLWGGLILEIKLPILVLGAFLAGFLPTFGWHRASRWRMQRRIESHERTLADMRGIDVAPPPGLTPAAASTIEPPAQIQNKAP
jgi:uncharacterized integral membrane protein